MVAGDRGNQSGRFAEFAKVDIEMVELAGAPEGKQRAGTAAYGARVQQAVCCIGIIHFLAQYLSRGRPTVSLRSDCVGALSGVK